MTEPRTPDDQPAETGASQPTADAAPPPQTTTVPEAPAAPSTTAATPIEPATPPPATPTSVEPADSPTQAWPSLTGPATGSWPVTPTASPAAEAALAAEVAPAAEALPAAASSGSPFEPAPSLTPAQVAPVAEGGTFGASTPAGGRRSQLRWGLALVGVLIVAVASFAIVSLVGGRPATSPAMGYIPADMIQYTEVRLDLPGDQRPKLATFLKAFPGFEDQSAIDPKLDDILDRLVRAASRDKQTWTANIKPWFGGQIAVGQGLPPSGANSSLQASNSVLGVVTITDRAKAIAWLTSLTDNSSINRTTYGDADLFTNAEAGSLISVAVNDKVMLVGGTAVVKAAIDSGGRGTFDQNDDVKAALATVDKDYVVFSVTRFRALADGALRMMAINQPGVLEKSQIDDTALAMVPAWQASTGRFENDALVATTVGPSWAIGYDTTNRPSDVLGHVPAKTLLYAEVHDAGPVLTAILAKFRALDEMKANFAQFDQALSLVGGADAVFGWWGDSAIVVSSLADGTIGGGLVVHPRDRALADRLLTTLSGFVALGAGNSGVTTRTEDHNGTKITIVDFSASPSIRSTALPPGYKAEFAWATNADVTVIGYGTSFVKGVLDAAPGNSLADDPRFKGLLGRVGPENIGASFLDLAAIRGLIEPIAQQALPADKWAYYTKEIQPYLKPLDAVISAIRRDGGLDRGSGAFVAH